MGDVAPGGSTDLPIGFGVQKIFSSVTVFDICSTNRSFWPGTTHNGQANMHFADGHVESARQTN